MKKNIWRSMRMLQIRAFVASVRRQIDPYYQLNELRGRIRKIEENLYYEMECPELWRPRIMGMEDTLNYILDTNCSVCRFGDGEFQLVNGNNMSFEVANDVLQERLIHILKHPLPNCLCCIPDVFGSLAPYVKSDMQYWRGAVLWMRPLIERYLRPIFVKRTEVPFILGNTLISRPYLGFNDKSTSSKIFSLWKKLFSGQQLLIIEGRYSRLGIGNDLFSGAERVRRIWCPPVGAFSHYDRIMKAIENTVEANELIILALGATATILAYDLAKMGYRAVDAGHLDLEYMWMKMGVTKKVAIPGRYVNECIDGREMRKYDGEEESANVIMEIQ